MPQLKIFFSWTFTVKIVCNNEYVLNRTTVVLPRPLQEPPQIFA